MRYPLIDYLRFLAIVLMLGYHCIWDLVEFNLVSRAFFLSPEVTFFGRLCLTTFLFCMGYSLALAYSAGIDWKKFGKRWLKLGLAAGFVSISTYIFYPKQWIYFGIIHHIAATSVLLLPLLKIPRLSLLLGLYILLPYWLNSLGLCQYAQNPLYPWLKPHCLYPQPLLFQPTLDFIALLPWTACSMLGIGAHYFQLHKKLQPPYSATIQWCSRQSLYIYLAHQPILYALIWLGLQIQSFSQ